QIRPGTAADRTDAARLMRRQDRELDPLFGEDIECFAVDGRLRQPHPLRLAPETVLEIRNPPDHLSLLITPVGEGHDEVVVDLGDGGAVPGKAGPAVTVGAENGFVYIWLFFGEPAQDRGAEVEAYAAVIVDDALDGAGIVENAG